MERVAVDVGGTFTDLVAFNPETGRVELHKVPSTPADPVQGMMAAIDRLGGRPIEQVIHGSTVATNAIVERKGARVAYITTRGFRDIPFLQRGNRRSHYDVSWIKPAPLVKRRDCFEVTERISWKGEILQPLDEEELRRLCRAIREKGEIEAVVVNFLFSYVDPRHELRAKEIIQEELPDIPVSISFEVHPKWKEYERASTTIADGYVKPLVARYVSRLTQEFARKGLPDKISIMKSNGGMMTTEAAVRSPVQMVLSGPTGGVVGARWVANLLGLDYVVSFDMGGTSCDVSTIVKGNAHFTTDFEIEWGIPIQVPMIDVRTIGAGGGSIAWLDKGGLLRVGPQSAGAVPGPACYGQGGQSATVTDANLLLGRLNPDAFLGGRMRLQVDKAREAIAALAKEIGMGVEETALSIIRIVNNEMMAALRMILIEQGYDPRDFSLVAFGGAGPLHCAELIREMNIPQAIVPVYPGAFSALGFLMSDARVDIHRTVQMTSATLDLNRVNQVLAELRDGCVGELVRQGYSSNIEVFASVEMRYLGQNYELEVPVPAGGLSEEGFNLLCETFHERHNQQYGFSIPGEPLEIVNFRVTALSPTTKPQLSKLPTQGRAEPYGTRKVYFESGPVETAVYRREHLFAGQRLQGPVVIEEEAATTLVLPGQSVEVDEYGNLIIRNG